MRARAPIRATALLAGSAALAGCFVGYRSESGPAPIDDEAAAAIYPGSTNRRHVLERLGPPDLVVRPGDVDAHQAAGAAALEVFLARGHSLEGRCVYVYVSVSASEVGGVVLLATASSRTQSKRRLWLLVDDASGVVEDKVLRDD